MGLRRTSHSVYDTKYHLVWAPKYRKDLFARKYIRERASELFQEIADEYSFVIEELEVSNDHVHLLISFPPKYSISRVVGILKSITARSLFQEFPRLRNRLWKGELWEAGFFARTVGEKLTSEVIQKYIKDHKNEQRAPAQLEIDGTSSGS